jgi:hypothetical protein
LSDYCSSAFAVVGTRAKAAESLAFSSSLVHSHVYDDVLDLYPRASIGGRVTVTWQRFDTVS